jgi:hypothetical protein
MRQPLRCILFHLRRRRRRRPRECAGAEGVLHCLPSTKGRPAPNRPPPPRMDGVAPHDALTWSAVAWETSGGAKSEFAYGEFLRAMADGRLDGADDSWRAVVERCTLHPSAACPASVRVGGARSTGGLAVLASQLDISLRGSDVWGVRGGTSEGDDGDSADGWQEEWLRVARCARALLHGAA